MAYRDLVKKAEASRRWRLANKDKVRESKARWRKQWRVENKGKAREQARKNYAGYREANPLKEKARYEVRKALLNGTLKKEPCVSCGENDLNLIEAHHIDYSEPLKIQWLCKDCHKELHNGEAREIPIFFGIDEVYTGSYLYED